MVAHVTSLSVHDIHIPIMLFDKKTTAQVDTGATVSVIPENLLPPRSSLVIFPNTVLKLEAYGGYKVPDRGFTRIPLMLNKKLILFPCLITATQGNRMLLGNDFLEFFEVLIDPKGRCVSSPVFGVIPFASAPTEILKKIGIQPIIPDEAPTRKQQCERKKITINL